MATQYAPAPASLTIISCKYENRQRLQFTTEFAKTNNNNTKNKHCSILPSLCRHCQSKAKNSRIWAQATCLFCPSNKLTFDLLTLKVLFQSRVTWATSVPILVFLSLSVLELRPMYSTERRQTNVRRQTKASFNASALWGRRHNKLCEKPPQYASAPCDLDLLTLKVVSESRVKSATSVPILVFLGLPVLDLGPMYATDIRQTSDNIIAYFTICFRHLISKLPAFTFIVHVSNPLGFMLGYHYNQ